MHLLRVFYSASGSVIRFCINVKWIQIVIALHSLRLCSVKVLGLLGLRQWMGNHVRLSRIEWDLQFHTLSFQCLVCLVKGKVHKSHESCSSIHSEGGMNKRVGLGSWGLFAKHVPWSLLLEAAFWIYGHGRSLCGLPCESSSLVFCLGLLPELVVGAAMNLEGVKRHLRHRNVVRRLCATSF